MKRSREDLLFLFAERLKTIRKLQGYTQERLAYESGLSLSQVARIETARINPTLNTLAIIAETLKVELKDLMDF